MRFDSKGKRELSTKIAQEKFNEIIEQQLIRVKKIKENFEVVDFKNLNKIILGIAPGDGIGPEICGLTTKVLKKLLINEIDEGKIELRDIEGLTIENRIATGETLPKEILNLIKECHVLLKGPTTTPQMGDGGKNLESANVAMRRELDLFANVRPIKAPDLGIDWAFFRENTEGGYAVGSKGVVINDEIAIDFAVTTDCGTRRIAIAAFDYARKTGKTRVTVVTKANIIKQTDGKFLKVCKEVAMQYPEITLDDKYVDIMSANLINKDKQSGFQVLILPNLYGDILTDEAAEIQGGVGTAGTANIGSRYAMFEAIHGSAPDLVEAGLVKYANPSSMLRAAVMMLEHIGYFEKAKKLEDVIDAVVKEGKIVIDGTKGATGEEFVDEILNKI